MPLRLFNTLSRQIEPFQPLNGRRVALYTCGPTVWNYAHIGNFRTFVFEDVLRRWLDLSGFEVLHVMNLTDVDDRTINAANAAGKPLMEHVAPFTQAFFEDRDYLRIKPAHHYPTATAFVPQQIALVNRLLDKGVAYQGADGSVYFAIGKFPTYGRLSRLDTREIKVGARVASDEYSKEDARDFALWKAAKPEDEKCGAAWDAPFGRGRPGWHLECSAMSQHLLGDTLDIHCGGVDLIFPHHEDEIAQSEAASGKTFARVWMHGEFLQVDGTKMSKRFGNFLTARDLKESGWDASAIRFLFAQTHYRKQLNFTDDALKGAAAGADRLGELRRRLLSAERAYERAGGATHRAMGTDVDAGRGLLKAVEELRTGFHAALDEDLDAPNALASLMTFARAANGELDRYGATGQESQALKALDSLADVLQVMPGWAMVPYGELPEATELAEERLRAKQSRDFARADQLRKTLLGIGFEVRDTKDGGYELRRVSSPLPNA